MGLLRLRVEVVHGCEAQSSGHIVPAGRRKTDEISGGYCHVTSYHGRETSRFFK
jgi:hypothetical protein